MKILLLGGTGAMGSHLKDILSGRGDDVYITSRKQRQDAQHIFYIQGNAHDLSFLSTLVAQQWDAIVDFMVYSTEEFRQRVGTLLQSTKQYVFISSSRVYSNQESPIKESSPRLLDVSRDEVFLGTDEYSLKKAREEDILFNSGKSNYTIVRPYITYSERRLQLGDLEHQYWLPRALDGRSIVFSEDIRDHMTTLTYGFDVANGIAALIGDERAYGNAFHITCGKSLKWQDVLDIYLDAIEECTGIRPRVKWTKHSLKLDKDKFKYQILYDRTFDRIFDNAKFLELAPNVKFTEPEAGLRKCIQSFVQSKESRMFSGMSEGIRDRISGERMKLGKLVGAKQKLLYIACRYFYFDIIWNKLINR